MSDQRKYFGTDGVRGRVGEYPITPDFVLKLGWAVGRVLAKNTEKSHQSKVLIGKDTRISGYMFEAALEAGLIAAGVDCHLLGPMPTPAIAYLTRTLRAQVGIVISASHNSYQDNGIKFFSDEGKKLPDDVERLIEIELEQAMTTVDSAELGKALRIYDAPGRYIEFCKSTFPSCFSLKGLKVILDCANGAAYHIAPNVFRELGAEVFELNVDPDGLNINEHCGATAPGILQRIVKAEKADVGIAFDGDADRLIMVNADGDVVDGDELLYIIARDLQEQNQLHGGVIGTVMSNMGLEKGFEELNIPFKRARVGDRYVMAMLQETGWCLGGESSGHIICLDLTTTGDGIISALQVLAAMCRTACTLKKLQSGMSRYPQSMVNVRINQKADPMLNGKISKAVKVVEENLKGHGRVLLRMSGTEPVIRIMVEADNKEMISSALEELTEVVKSEMSS